MKIKETTISFVSLGCDKNLVDSEIMLGLIDRNGYKVISEENEADIVIVNTCGFKLDATEESIENILKITQYKNNANCKGVIVTGCMVQRYKEELLNEIPEIDAIIGTNDFDAIIEVIEKVLEGEKVSLLSDVTKLVPEKMIAQRMLTTPSHYAYIKIAEGCDNRCTYCTIPSIRGKYRSRTIENIVLETIELVEKGVKELIIVAQDTSVYGKDIYGEIRLVELLQEISKVEGLIWIRLMYLYPEAISEKLIDEIASNEKICNYVDIPIQHSSDFILKKMARMSSRKLLLEKLYLLKSKIPNISLRTTIMVGFPYETDEHFKDLCEFIKEIKFDKLGVFEYCQEDGTKSAKMDNQVEEHIKKERKEYILALQKNISASKTTELIGQTLNIIVDGKLEDDNNVYCGRTFKDCVDVDGLVFFNCDYPIMSGEFVNVKITEGLDYDLIGDLID